MDLNSPLVDVHGRQIFTFGGENALQTYHFKGYLVSLEWFVGMRSSEPMMVIQDQKQGFDNGAVGICLTSIGAYADPSGGPALGAIERCKEHLPTLGKASIDLEAKLLLDVILQFTPALILMPPTPRKVVQDARPAPLIDVTIKHEETGKIHSEVRL